MSGRKIFASWPAPNFSQAVKTHKNYRNAYNGALMYAHYEFTAAELKKETVKYLKSLDSKHPLLSKVQDIHENRFTTIGKYMYVLNNRGELPDSVISGLFPYLEKIINEEDKAAEKIRRLKVNIPEEEKEAKETDEPARPVVSIQDRLREKARETASELEGWVDELLENKKSSVKTVEEFVNFFKAQDIKGPHARHIVPVFLPKKNEFELLVSGKDKDLNEGYSNLSKPEAKKFLAFYTNLLAACDMIQQVAKVSRQPRKKKAVSVDKLVAKLKYKKEDTALGIVSVSPTQILSSKEVWIYNTKTRKLAQYKAADERGISVKGASLINFTTDSVEKTLRKPAESLTDFKKASKVKLRTFIKELSTVDVPASGRLNEHCVILRVDK